MSFSISIQGDVADDDTTSHAMIQSLCQDLVNKLASGGAITITASQVETPSGTTTPIPSQPQAAASA